MKIIQAVEDWSIRPCVDKGKRKGSMRTEKWFSAMMSMLVNINP